MVVNIQHLLREAKVSIDDELTTSPTVIKVGTHNWGSLSNFSAVIGKAKSKKSFLLMMAVAAGVQNLNRHISVDLPRDKKTILYFDTEQSKYHLHRSLNKIATLAETSPDNVEAYGLRKFEPHVRLQLIEEAIYSSKTCSLVIIDGIRDLLTSINDEEQATMITSKLLKWTEENEVHIIVVLHQNKGDNNARGHVGSEIINKAETVISVTRDNQNSNISIVKADYAREQEFEPFAFTIDELGLPILLPDHLKKESKKVHISDELHTFIIHQAFEINPTPRYNQLVTHLQHCFEKNNMKIGENKAKTFITQYILQQFIVKVENSGGYPYYRINIK